MRLGEGASLGQRPDEDLDGASGEQVDVVWGEVERQSRLVLGVGDPPGALRELSGVPGGPGQQPERATDGGVLAHRRDRGVGLGEVFGEDQRPHAAVKARPAARVSQQQIAIECPARERSAGGGVRGAELGRQPRAMGQTRRVSGSGRRRHRRGRAARRVGSLRVTLGDHDQHLQRGHLERQTGIGTVVGGDLPGKECGQFIVVGVKHVPRGEPGQEVDPAGVVVDLGQGLAQAITRSGQAGVEGGHRERSQHLSPIVAGRSFVERPLQIGRGGVWRATSSGADRRVPQRRRGGAVAVRSALEQVRGDDVALGPVRSQRARGLAVKAFGFGARQVLEDRGGDQRVRKPPVIRARAARPPRERPVRRSTSPSDTPATAATTWGGSRSPSTARAAPTARSPR